MRRTVSMHTVYNKGGDWVDQLTITQTRESVRKCMQAVNLVSGPMSQAQAMRDIMDEQTVEFKFRTFVVRFELDTIV